MAIANECSADFPFSLPAVAMGALHVDSGGSTDDGMGTEWVRALSMEDISVGHESGASNISP